MSNIKRNWFHKEAHYRFVACLEKAGSNYNIRELINMWLEMAFIALCQVVNKVKHKFDESLEDRYIRLSKHIPNEVAGEAMSILVVSLEDESHDFLGGVLSALDSLNVKGAGQVFTPTGMCDLMSALIFPKENPDDYSITKRLSIMEPAVGGGATLISAVKQLRSQGFSNRKFLMVGSDIDMKCLYMSYIQLTLMDVPALIKHQNTLTLETWGMYPTIRWHFEGLDESNYAVC